MIGRRTLMSLAGGVSALAAYRSGVSYVRGELFLPDRTPNAVTEVGGTSFQLLTVSRRDGTSVTGLMARATAPARAVVLYLHGNAGNALKGAQEAAVLVRAGFDVMVGDYRGYGGNAGQPSEAGLVEDASAFLDRTRGFADARPVLLVGHSLGGAVAILIAAGASVAGLLTLGAPARVEDLVPRVGRPFLLDRFDALGAAPGIRMPWIIAHGEMDDVVPVADASRLFGSRPPAGRELALLPASGHAVEASHLVALTERLYGAIAVL